MRRAKIILTLAVMLLAAGCNTKEKIKTENTVNEKAVAVSVKESVKHRIDEKAKDEKAAYDYSAPVPKGERVEKSYFKDALFIGDSRTVGFMQCVRLPGATDYASEGCLVNAALTQVVKLPNGESVSAAEALIRKTFGKVYLMYGVNETGWDYTSKFIERYQKLIRYVKKTQNHAVIYVQAIYPVAKKVSDTHDYITNDRIREYNEALQKLAAKEKVYFVNVAEAVSNEEGALPKGAAVDGIHLRKAYCKRWLSYLRNHTIEE